MSTSTAQREDEEAASANERPADSDDTAPSDDAVRRIVLSRETVPRPPRWARAFRRLLMQGSRSSRMDRPEPQNENGNPNMDREV